MELQTLVLNYSSEEISQGLFDSLEVVPLLVSFLMYAVVVLPPLQLLWHCAVVAAVVVVVVAVVVVAEG